MPTASWWPATWRLPSAFAHAIWLVAPPRNLEAGQVDLVGEMREASKGNENLKGAGWTGATIDPKADKKRDVHRALGRHGESPAWWNVKWGLIACLVAWLFLLLGFTIEVINQGTTHPALLNAFGMPNNARDPRYRKPKPYHDEAFEVGTGGVLAGPARSIDTEDVERRLQESVVPAALSKEISSKLHDLMPYLNALASGKAMGSSFASMASLIPVARAQPARATLLWPSMFEPRVLACGHEAAAAAGQVALALSHFGRGAIVTTSATAQGAKEIPADTTAFALEGISGVGHLIAATWDKHGLLLASSSGVTLECPGAGPTNGRWRCNRNGKLPTRSTGQLFRGAVALSRDGQSFKAVMSFPGEASLQIFRSDGRWRPAGEVRTHAPVTSAAFVGTDVLLSSADGAVASMKADGTVASVGAAIAGTVGHSWLSTCGLAAGGLARLALADGASPTLFLG